MRLRTIPYAAGTAVAAIGATLLLSGSASAAPAGDDRDPAPPGPILTVCSLEDGAPPPAGEPRFVPRSGAEPHGYRHPGTPKGPEVDCPDEVGVGTCEAVPAKPVKPAEPGADVLVPAKPAEPGADVLVPAPGEPGTHVERRDGSGDTFVITCEGPGAVRVVPRR
ncbi:hypothetical protein ACQEVB_37950 [Pseudonocardia sp. CA-107938]|uniref:hypothetical protein n=1 Tax=Pseudonocardia sp. CA-107938 TaxID=3240021 RepID=UPI003D89F4C3